MAVFDLKPPVHGAMLKIISTAGYRKVNMKLSMKEGQNIKLWLLQIILVGSSEVVNPLPSVLLLPARLVLG